MIQYNSECEPSRPQAASQDNKNTKEQLILIAKSKSDSLALSQVRYVGVLVPVHQFGTISLILELASQFPQRISSTMVSKDPFNLPTSSSASVGGASVATAIADNRSNGANHASQSTNRQDYSSPSQPVTPRFLGWTQVRTLVGKNFLTKWRTPFGTFFEIFSPVLMMLVLVAAFTLSEVTQENSQQYDTISASLPGPWLNLVEQAVNLGTGGDLDTLFSRRRRKLRTTTVASQGLSVLQDLGFATIHNRRLQTQDNTTNIADDDSLFDLLDGTSDELTSLLANPVPVPSFDQYVAASLGLSSLIDPDDLPIILSDSSYGRSWGNLLTLGILHLSPDTDVVSEFRDYLNATYPDAVNSIQIQIHESEETAVKYINNNLNNRTWALLDFSDYANEEDVSYKIRMNYTTLPNTNQIVNFVSIGLDTKFERYYLSGYLTLQRTLNEFAMARIGCETTTFNIWSMPMPTAAYNQNAFFQAVGFLLGLTIAMAFVYPTSRTIKTMVEEKELRLKETLSILGVRPWAHFWSWLLTSLAIFGVIAILVTVTLTANILTHSNPVYIFAFIGLFSTSVIGFCFVIAACFSKAKLAAIVGPMALFATLLPRFIFFGSNRYEAITAKQWASLLPCTAFAFGADIIADYEYAEVGIQSWNASEGEYSFNTAVGFLFVDTLLYIFLGWYLELVIPRQYGVARPWYFLLLPSYWASIFCFCGKSTATEASPGVPVATEATSEEDSADFEPVTDPSWIPRVVIDDLVKRYSKKPDIPPAVNHLNLTLYESQITCLLGHNGAGKTSTISILTGLFPPTSGDCFIYGNSIVSATNEARQSMGICPQHNVLFDGLTVTEHLSFFQKIKGLKPTKSGLRQSAEDVGLSDYLRTTSAALSGGNKRKLSLAIALCGDPQFLLLDEPTSGMDVASRRNCWELLRRKRQGRVTLLTTHFLDEASLLADRIAIMKEGQLQCCGSELFLKNRFGLGYNLTIVLASAAAPTQLQASSNGDEVESMENGSNGSSPGPSSSSATEGIATFLNRYIPDTKLIRKSARELTFRFPQGSEGSFPDVFDALEEERCNLSVGAYGISDTTLEEIFLHLAETEVSQADSDKSLGKALNGTTNYETMKPKVEESAVKETTEQKSGKESVPCDLEHVLSRDDLQHLNPLRQIALLYRKRFVIQRRDLKGAFFQIVLPVLLCGLVLLVLTLDIILAGPPIEMSMSLYRSGIDGTGARTDVVVGGGMTIETVADSRRLSVVAEEFKTMSSTLHNQYPNTEFVNLDTALSSSDVSQHLLDTYNDQDHNARYGSFALYDRINMSMSIDWNDLRTALRSFTTSTFDSDGVVDVGSFLGINGTLIEFNVTLPEVEGFISQLMNLTENATVTVDTVSLKNTTQSVLQNITDSSLSSKGTIVVQDLRNAFNTLVDRINEIQRGSTNSTLTDVATSFVDDLLSTVTDGAIQDLNATTAEEIAEVLSSPNDTFDRPVIVEGMLKIFDDLFAPVGGTRGASEAIVNLVIQAFDGAAVLLNSNLTSAPNKLLVLPIIFLDEFAMELFDNFGANATLSLGDLLNALVDTWPGDDPNPVGYIHVKAENMTLDFSSQRVVLDGIWIETMSEAIVMDGKIELNMTTALDDMETLLPSGLSRFVIGFNTDVTVLHNSSSPHSVGAFNQAYMEYMFKQCNGNPFASRLVSVNHPLPLTDQQTIEINTILSILASLFLLIPYCYFPGAFIVFLVKERVSKSKHLQLVSGVELTSYWISSYLWDLTVFFVLTMLIMVVFLIYGRESAVTFVGDSESFLATTALTFGYGLSVLPFSYLLSRPFNNHSSAQIAVMGILFICGFVAVNAYFILSTIESTQDLAQSLRPMFRWWPPYLVGEGFIQLAQAYWEREILGSERYPLDWDVTGKTLAIIYALAFPYFLLLLLLEYSDDGGAGGPVGRILRVVRSAYSNMVLRCYGVRKGPDGISLLLDDGLDDGRQEDDDVADERACVEQNRDHLKATASVLLVNMWKVFPPTVGFFGKTFAGIRRIFNLICCCGCFRRQPAPVEDDDENDKSNLPKRAVRGVSTAIMEGETYGLLGGTFLLQSFPEFVEMAV